MIVNEQESIDIFPCTSAHVHDLVKIGKITFTEAFAAQNTEEDFNDYLGKAFSFEQIQSEVTNPDSIFYLATVGGRAIGYLKLNFARAQTDVRDTNALEIERIYVLNEFQGKGIGASLLEKAIDVARDHQLTYLWLGVWEENRKAIAFYKKFGFKEFGTHTFQLGKDLQLDLLLKLEITLYKLLLFLTISNTA